jgi:PAS domain S-box-containing protein
LPGNARPESQGERGATASTACPTPPRELERQLAAAQQITHIGSWEWEISTGVVRWSDELYRIYGLEPQSIEITFEVFLSRIHPDDRERVQSAVRLALEGGRRFAHRERIVRPDSSVRDLDSIGEVLYDAAGKQTGLIGSCRDVTEELARDETLRLYAHIVQSIPIGFSVWRVTGEADPALVAFNPAIERAVGVSLSEATGKAPALAMPVLSTTELPELLARASKDGQVRVLPQCALDSGDGQRIFAARVFPLPGGSVGLSLEDVTRQVRSRQLQAAEQRVLEMVVAGADRARDSRRSYRRARSAHARLDSAPRRRRASHPPRSRAEPSACVQPRHRRTGHRTLRGLVRYRRSPGTAGLCR